MTGGGNQLLSKPGETVAVGHLASDSQGTPRAPNPIVSKDLNDFATFDIETTGLRSKMDRITAIGVKTSKETNIFMDSSEEKIVRDFFSFLDGLNEEIIVGYNSDNFDWKFLREACARNNVEFPGFFTKQWCGRLDLEGAPSEAFERGYVTLQNNMQTVDLYPIVTAIPGSHRWRDRTLATAAHQLGAKNWDEQIHIPHDEIEEVRKNDPERFKRYLEDDLDCTYELAKILLPQEFELAEHTGAKLQENVRLGWSSLIEKMMEKEYRRRGFGLPERESTNERPKEFMRKYGRKGAKVELKYRGVVENVAKLDVSSMYPSIMLTYNYFPQKDKYGIFREKLKELMNRRLELKAEARRSTDPKKKKALDARQGALKFLINSFNGHMGYARGRWRDYNMHCNVLEKGRELIEKIVRIIETEGYDWAEYDTDGVMTIEMQNEDVAKKLVVKINGELPEGIKIEFENFWKRAYFHKRKHYAVFGSAENEIEFVGGWFLKRDTPEIINSAVRNITQEILSGKQPEEIRHSVQGILSRLERGEVEKRDLVFRKHLNKPIEKYETSPQHVKAASHAKEVGEDVSPGDIIEYFISKNGPRHISSFGMEEVDFDYYYNRVVSRVKITLSEIYGIEEDVIFNYFIGNQEMLDGEEIDFSPKKQLMKKVSKRKDSSVEESPKNDGDEEDGEKGKFVFKEFGWGLKEEGIKQRNIFYDVVNNPEKAVGYIEAKGKTDVYTSVYRYQVDKPDLIRRTTPRKGFWYADSDHHHNDPIVNLKKSLEDTRKFFQHLIEEWGIPPEIIRINYSGCQGVHLEVPQNVFGLPTSCKLPQIYREITRQIGEKLGFKLKSSATDTGTIDLTIYDNKRLWGITNTVHPKTGRYRIPLSPEDLDPKKAEEIFERAKSPSGEPVFFHEGDDLIRPVRKAKEKVKEIMADLNIEDLDHGGVIDFKRKPENTKKFRQYISRTLEREKVTELPPCCKRIIELIRKGNPIGWHGRRKLAYELKKLGKSKEEIADIFAMAPDRERYGDIIDRLLHENLSWDYDYNCHQVLNPICSLDDCPYVHTDINAASKIDDPSFEEYQKSVGRKLSRVISDELGVELDAD